MKKHIALFSTTLLFASFLGGARAFAEEQQTEANPKSAETTVTGQLQLSEDGGFNPNPPSPELNKKTNITNSYFGIAYVPETFNIGNVALADTNEEQNIVMYGPTGQQLDGKSFHVAVKDKNRKEDRGWTLKAKLSSPIENNNLGIKIKTGTQSNSVKRNMNDGTTAFQPTDLIDQVKKDGSNMEITNSANLEITTVDANVMQAQSGKFVNGAYDLELPQVELHIPDASKVKAQTLTTNVTWTLTNAAQ
ncbi:WxL domain-containing protein [Enterococcus gallinarum]|uniref:WxL domain-containing protein n=1 Tax=Enterococcus gallinarum TaxID=1353 RepID=UPI0018AB40A6|nr:WxL domain-containing protein [Enterococcus gallinarum]